MERASSSSSSPSFSSSNRWVYLSYCVEDSVKGFTSHLKKALSKKGFDTLTHEDNKSIEDSWCSIIIFSPNYASSTSRLDEIVKIMECKKNKGLIVIPVFYRLHPTNVRKLTGTFGEEFSKHGEDFRAQRWRDALEQVTAITGKHLQNGDEAEFIGKIVEVVSSKLSSTSAASSNISGTFFGVNSRVSVARLNSYLSTWTAGIPGNLCFLFFFFKFFFSIVRVVVDEDVDLKVGPHD